MWSAAIFDDLHNRWAGTLGAEWPADPEGGLRAVVPAGFFPLDVACWFGG